MSTANIQRLLFLICTGSVLSLYLFSQSLLPRLEMFERDLLFQMRGHLSPENHVVIATIDERSIDHLGRWPWQRSTIAKLINNLSENGARAIGFDIVFSSPESSKGLEELHQLQQQSQQSVNIDQKWLNEINEAIKRSDNDAILAKSVADSSRTVLGYFFHFNEENITHLSASERKEYVDIVKPSRYSGIRKKSGTHLKLIPFTTAYAVEATIQSIASQAKGQGYFNFYPELDGAIRKIPLLVKYRDKVDLIDEPDYLFSPLSINLLKLALDGSIAITIDSYGVEQVIIGGDKSIRIPTDPQGELWINYYGPRNTFPYLSVIDILEGKVDPEEIRGKIVLIGTTAMAIEDIRITPFDQVYPGVEIHATVMDNLLSGRSLQIPPIPKSVIDTALIIFVGILLFLVLTRVKALSGVLITFSIMLALIYLNYLLFSQFQLVISMAPAMIEGTLLFILLYTYRYISEERDRRYIKGAFSQYLSPVVIDALIADPEKLQLGGVRKDMTAFFSDVAGFSTISEKLTPEELVHLLNEYLTAMTDIILEFNGTVDKYEGDAIIAFFGAPLDDPHHAKHCCLMALKMQRRLQELNQQWDMEGRPQLKVRIGINSGPMVVGNMGSTMRMDYTMMGDAVNLAARLEGANKAYGTHLMISHHTYELCKESIEVRELDTLRVVGKSEPITVYEVLGEKGSLDSMALQKLQKYHEGILKYKNRDWRGAIDCFGKLFDENPDDGPSLNYLERCLEYHLRPPAKDWDGVHILTSK